MYFVTKKRVYRHLHDMSLQEFKSRILPMKDKLIRFSQSLVGDTAEAEDIVQEVLIRIWDRRDEWHEMDNLEGYCMRMARNMSIDRIRSRKNRTEELDRADHLLSRDNSAQADMENREAVARVRNCIERLPEKQRTVIRLREIEGMSYLDIAGIMEITLDQVKVNIYRARMALKHELLKLESYGLS